MEKVLESSSRALELTENLIRLNPAHYTIWSFRQNILTASETPVETFKAELMFVDEMLDEHPKSYQLWHHRAVVVSKLGREFVESGELDNIDRLLDDDSKNYHAWSYRCVLCFIDFCRVVHSRLLSKSLIPLDSTP